jgi:hypothetical protein
MRASDELSGSPAKRPCPATLLQYAVDDILTESSHGTIVRTDASPAWALAMWALLKVRLVFFF